MSPAVSDYTDNKVDKVLKIEYTKDGKTGTVNYPITIINDVKSIEVFSTNHKTEYNVNDALDVTNLEIKVTRAVGSPEPISVTSDMVTGFDSTRENTQLPLTITYTENGIQAQTTYNVSVKDTVTSISLNGTTPSKVKYGEELNLDGVTIEVAKGSGTTTENVTESMISGFDKNTLGEQTVKITYEGQEVTFKVKVQDYVTKIEVSPNSVTGTYNEELSSVITNNNIKYTVTYASAGAKTPEALTDDMVTGYNKTSTTAQNLTVKYTDNDVDSYTNGQEFTTDLEVTLMNTVSGITITKPSKSTYKHGESIDLTGGEINLTYEDGTTGKLNISNATITEADGSEVNMSPAVSDYTDNKVDKTLKIEYTKDGKTGTIDYPITIINDVKSIIIETSPKTDYKVNESLDISAGTLKVQRACGGAETIPMTNSNVTVEGFDSTQENENLELTVTYTENGIQVQTTYNVSVVDTVISAVIEITPKTEYKYGEPLDVSTGKIKVTKDSGEEFIDMKDSMVKELDGTSFDSTKIGTRNLKVTYGGIEMTYEITVSDYITGMTLQAPTKDTYEYGESLDLTGGYITIIMASGTATTPVALTDSSVTVSGYNKNQEGTQTITVTYEGKQLTFAVKVIDSVQNISLVGTPKTEYKYGDPLDITGLSILATKSSGSTETITVTESMVSGYDPNTLGNQTITIKYKSLTTSFNVNVVDYVKDIEIVKPNKLVYALNEAIDLTGGTVTEIMASGATKTPIVMSIAMISGFDSSTEGVKKIKVTYSGFTKEFGITVQDLASSMIIKTLPDKLDYIYGEPLDVSGGTIEITKESGAKEVINITKSMVTGYNPNKLGSQVLTITYEQLTKQYTITVTDYIKKLQVTAPNKTTYEYGESLDLEGGKVSIIMASGAVKESVDLAAYMVSGYDATKAGSQTIKVKYKDLEGSFLVKVIDKVKGISMNTEPDKTTYKKGENLDVSGATIIVSKSSGKYVIPVTQSMVSGYNPQNLGTQVITVTYEGYTTTFVITVEKAKDETNKDDNKKPNKPNKPNNSNKNNENNNTTGTTDIKEDTPTIENNNSQDKNINQVPSDTNNKPSNNNKTEDKPTETLGVKDEKDDDIDNNTTIAISIAGLALLLLCLLLIFRHNVKVYVEEDGEFVLGGLDKVSKNNLKINVDKYLDSNTYLNKVKIVFSESISDKLNGYELEITHRGVTSKHKIVYEDKPYEIILNEVVQEKTNDKT